jgi:hypothetical protein
MEERSLNYSRRKRGKRDTYIPTALLWHTVTTRAAAQSDRLTQAIKNVSVIDDAAGDLT